MMIVDFAQVPIRSLDNAFRINHQRGDSPALAPVVGRAVGRTLGPPVLVGAGRVSRSYVFRAVFIAGRAAVGDGGARVAVGGGTVGGGSVGDGGTRVAVGGGMVGGGGVGDGGTKVLVTGNVGRMDVAVADGGGNVYDGVRLVTVTLIASVGVEDGGIID